MSHSPLIGITMGDPSWIGPEILLKALSAPAVRGICRPVVLGDPGAVKMKAFPTEMMHGVLVSGEGFGFLLFFSPWPARGHLFGSI